jgi:tRNA pseudouridine55 synthase
MDNQFLQHTKPAPIDLQEVHAGAMLLLDKPLTWTSFQAINKVKYLLKKPKIGHSGTLDPLASGLLIVCTGKWTKKLADLIGLDKEYTGTITLGATTPTFDLESDPENFKPYEHISAEDIENARQKFLGQILQYPPIHSAVKVDGKRAYELARKGKEVEIKPRTITIQEFAITNVQLPQVHFKVACTSGTYLRSLANDFGAALGVGGYLSALRRTKIGQYRIEEAHQMQDLIDTFSQPK